jgi:hypothetical protein
MKWWGGGGRDGPQARLGSLLPVPEIEPRLLGCESYSVVAIPTAGSSEILVTIYKTTRRQILRSLLTDVN